jgi:hypothetical protein
MSKQLPYSGYIEYPVIARIFKNTSATYKFYWFLSIIECVEHKKNHINKYELFCKMIANAWFPIKYFKLSFGPQDKIREIIDFILSENPIDINKNKNQIEKQLLSIENKNVIKKIWYLDLNVPFKFLTPWFGALPKREIHKKSQENQAYSIYRIFDNEIIVNPNWSKYISDNSKVLKDYVYWNLASFVQKRNPNTPDVIHKLIKPVKRQTLSRQRNEFWNHYLKSKKTRCIFTNEIINIDHYDVDHFIPFSWVSHDQIWNLIPVSASFNRSKNDKLPPIEKYFDDFYKIQEDAVHFFGNKMNKSFQEEYLTIFPYFLKNKTVDYDRFKQIIEPQLLSAHNNGFEYLE